MLFVERDQAKTLAVDLPDRADATPTFVLKDDGGGALVSSTNCTLDAVNTTLGGAAAKGATSVTVASAAGITVGRKYLLTAAEDTGGERVTVKAVSGTTVTLVRPLRLDHASGAAFKSTRVTCAVAAQSATHRGARLEITWAVSTVAQPTWREDVAVVRYLTESRVTSFDDVADVDPILQKRLPAGAWFPATRDEAWAEVLDRVHARVEPGAVVSASALARAHKYLIRVLLAETAGAEWSEYRDRMAARFAEVFEAAVSAAHVDRDNDGAVESHERAYRGIDIARG